MSSSNFNRISISSAAQKIEVDHRISLAIYYQIAENLLKQASIYREEKNNIDLYIILLRFCSLITETIPFHRDYHATDRRKRSSFKRKLLTVLEELESLKPEMIQLNEARGNTTRMSSEASSSFFDREQQDPNSAGGEMSRLSISISLRSPSQSSSQSIHHDSSENNSTFPPVNAMPSPSAPPMEDDADSSLSRSSSTTSSSCACVVCLDAPIEGACVPCGRPHGWMHELLE